MIPLLSRARSRLADILDSRRLARTVLVLSRQLDHAHLAGQIEEARADRLEERVAELEAETRDWSTLSGELVAEQAAADLPDLEPADDSGPPSPLPADPYARAEIERERADAAERRLAAEAHAADLENELATTSERAARLSARLSVVALEREEQIQRADGLAQTLQSCGAELATTRAQLRQTERSAGAHLATIEDLREQIAAAHAPARSLEARAEIAWRAWDEAPDSAPGGAPPPEATGWDSVYPGAKAAWRAVVRACDTSAAPAEQIPGVAAADALTESERREGYQIGKQTGIGFAAGCQAIAESKARKKAAADTPPETRPSARLTTREEPRP